MSKSSTDFKPDRPVVIRFEPTTPFYALSMAYGGPIRLKTDEGKPWLFPTLEHWIGYNQVVDPEIKRIVLSCRNNYILGVTLRTLLKGNADPEKIPKYVRLPEGYDGSPVKVWADWEYRRDAVMRLGIDAKFRSHRLLQHILLDTGTAPILDSSMRDPYWCITEEDGVTWGANRHGELLQDHRDALRQHQQENWSRRNRRR